MTRTGRERVLVVDIGIWHACYIRLDARTRALEGKGKSGGQQGQEVKRRPSQHDHNQTSMCTSTRPRTSTSLSTTVLVQVLGHGYLVLGLALVLGLTRVLILGNGYSCYSTLAVVVQLRDMRFIRVLVFVFACALVLQGKIPRGERRRAWGRQTRESRGGPHK